MRLRREIEIVRGNASAANVMDEAAARQLYAIRGFHM